MEERLYAGQGEWSAVSPDEAQAIFVDYAEELGLDTEQFAADLDEGTYQEKVMASYEVAAEVGLPGTPTIFMNDQYFQAPLSYYYLDAFVQLELLAEEQYDAPPEMAIDPDKQYRATIKTEKGDIVIELEAEKAPEISFGHLVRLEK